LDSAAGKGSMTNRRAPAAAHNMAPPPLPSTHPRCPVFSTALQAHTLVLDIRRRKGLKPEPAALGDYEGAWVDWLGSGGWNVCGLGSNFIVNWTSKLFTKRSNSKLLLLLVFCLPRRQAVRRFLGCSSMAGVPAGRRRASALVRAHALADMPAAFLPIPPQAPLGLPSPQHHWGSSVLRSNKQAAAAAAIAAQGGGPPSACKPRASPASLWNSTPNRVNNTRTLGDT
jgi:hypothetical protein